MYPPMVHYAGLMLKGRPRNRAVDHRGRYGVHEDSPTSAKGRQVAAIPAMQAAISGGQASAYDASMVLQPPSYPLPRPQHLHAIPSQAIYPYPYLPAYTEYDGQYGTVIVPPVLQQPHPSPKSATWPVPSTTSRRPFTRKGPPHKPKQSGHACWVGNILPGDPQAILLQLKDHFSVNFAEDIESVLYIARTGCAFVNYQTREACDDAIRSFSGTLFNGARLLCRVKRDTLGEDQVPTSPSPAGERKDSRALSVEVDKLSDLMSNISCATIAEEEVQHSDNDEMEQPPRPRNILTDRYFILKSFSREDLQDSRKQGTWVAQPQIQKTLHTAYQESNNVYLVFSVNKSKAYYGYAKMLSSPLDDHAVEHAVEYDALEGVTMFKVIATESAPPGRVVDDPTRATLFWEAEREHGEARPGNRSPKPRTFRIQWLRVRTLSFHHVRGIRNPWNGYKDVKVARDGTELETSIGKRIVQMFGEDYRAAYDDNQRRPWPA